MSALVSSLQDGCASLKDILSDEDDAKVLRVFDAVLSCRESSSKGVSRLQASALVAMGSLAPLKHSAWKHVLAVLQMSRVGLSD